MGARVLEEGGPEMQQRFMAELRREHLGAPADGSDEPAGTAVAAELQVAYEEAHAGIACSVRTSENSVTVKFGLPHRSGPEGLACQGP